MQRYLFDTDMDFSGYIELEGISCTFEVTEEEPDYIAQGRMIGAVMLCARIGKLELTRDQMVLAVGEAAVNSAEDTIVDGWAHDVY